MRPATKHVLGTSSRAALRLLATLGELPLGWALDHPAQAGGRVARRGARHELCLLDAGGTAQAIGTQGGRELSAATRRLMHLMRCSPGMLLARVGRRGERLCAAIPEPYRSEAVAWAAAAGCDAQLLLRSNAVADACCTALACGPTAQTAHELILGRNLDFFPAGALGRTTLVTVYRRDGCLPLASVGWPGFNGVLSGMNARGVCGVVLLNLSAHGAQDGAPIGYRLRALLEQATSLEEAIGHFAAAGVGSSHYLLLADRAHAAVVWQEQGRLHRHALRDGWLSCSNGARGADGRPSDARGLHLEAARPPGLIDDAWMRSAITATYLPGINAQAMVFRPGRLELQLAVGDACHPAALAPWARIDLRAVFAGTTLAAGLVLPIGRSRARRHYSRSWPVAAPSHASLQSQACA